MIQFDGQYKEEKEKQKTVQKASNLLNHKDLVNFFYSTLALKRGPILFVVNFSCKLIQIGHFELM